MSKIIFSIALLFTSISFSQTTISGNIGGTTLTPSGNPWIVLDNVFVESDNKVEIEPGCVILFKPFSGIIIQGSLLARGTTEMPVIFTSINDTNYNASSERNPEPFDWNGITIEKSAGIVTMKHFELFYSVFGIKSQIQDIEIEKGVFRHNGQFHFTINDKIQEVENNLPFSYSKNDKKQQSQPSVSRKWVKPVGIGTITIGTALLGTMGYFIYSAFDNDKKYDNNSEYGDVQHYLVKRDNAVMGAIITGINGGVLVPTGTGLLIWEHKKKGKKKTVSLYPVTGEANGIKMVLKF